MEIIFKDYKLKDKKLSFTIKENKINGLYGTHLEEIIELIKLNVNQYDNIKVNKKDITPEIIKDIKKKIVVVNELIEKDIHENTIKEYLIEYMKQYEIYPKNLNKKLLDALKIVDLSEDILLRNIYSVSSSEQKLIQLVKALLINPEIIVLENIFAFFDMKTIKRIMLTLRKLKDRYNKTIIITSNNTNMLYQETEHLIVYKNDRLLIDEDTITAFQKVEFLKKHDIPIPEIVEFTFLVKKNKKIKIDYHKDIRDIIKDIYKHV